MADDNDTLDASGIGFTPKTYEVAPEDAALAASIQDFTLYDVPGPVTGGEGMKVPDHFTASILPSDKRAEVEQALVGIPENKRADHEHALVKAALEQNHFEMMVSMGPGAGANALQREVFDQNRKARDLQNDLRAVMADLAEIVEKRPVTDPTTGQTVWQDVFKLEGEPRRQAEFRRDEITHRLSLLAGIEGERGRAKATVEAVAEIKAKRAQLEEDAAARKLAEEMVRDKRVEEKARLYAKGMSGLS